MSVFKFFLNLILIFVIVCLVMNESIFSYIEQKYHLAFYPQNELLKEASSLKNKLEQVKMAFSKEKSQSKIQILEANLSTFEPEISKEILNFQDENLSLLDENLSFENNNTSFINDSKLLVGLNDEFLFVGDSLMQGVGVALNKDLRALKLKAIDISKQNTGLSYKSYFDWAKATKNALKNNLNIKYLVVLLGANDPWDIKKDGIYHTFNSPSWLKIYTKRVDELIKIAQENKVRVLWFEIPPVKKADLNEKIQILNNIYSKELLKNNEIFVNTKLFFSINNAYSSYIKNENNKSIKLRSDDGVHFTPNGAKKMSKLLLEHLRVENENFK